MMKSKTKIADYTISKRHIEVNDLSFLSDRNHRYGWIRRHFKHHLLRRALKKNKAIIASNPAVAYDLRRFYFIPKERISLRVDLPE